MGGNALAIVNVEDGDFAKPGDFIESEVKPGLITSLKSNFSGLSSDLDSTLRSADTLMNSLNDLVIDESNQGLKSTIAELNASLKSFQVLSSTVQNVIDQNDEKELAEVSAPMAGAMMKDYPQVELASRFRNRGSKLVRRSGTELYVKEPRVAFADSTFFEMFGVELLQGDTKTALVKPGTLVLTKTAAEKHFNIENAVGQILLLDNNDTYEVTGVMNDFPKNSFLRNHTILMAMSGYDDSKEDEWGNHNYPTFIKMVPTAKIEEFQEPLQTMVGRYVIPWVQQFFPGITEEQFIASGNYLNFSTMPLTDIHLPRHLFIGEFFWITDKL